MCEAIGPESAKYRSLSPSVFAYLHVARAVLGALASGTEEGLDETMMTETQRKAYETSKKHAYDFIADRTDGPVTAFVAMSRAVELARTGKCPVVGIDDPIANALVEFLPIDGGETLLSSSER
jgi:hypothetical protein